MHQLRYLHVQAWGWHVECGICTGDHSLIAPFASAPDGGGGGAMPDAAKPDAAAMGAGPRGPSDCGFCAGPVANSVCGRDAAAALVRCCSASRRSAGVPCRSPLVSFLKAYETVIDLRRHSVASRQPPCAPI